jgi:hypothetical protein
MFNGRLPAIVVSSLRVLFKLDYDLVTAIEDALLEHVGEGTPGLEAGTNAPYGDLSV